jgi:TonB family protein
MATRKVASAGIPRGDHCRCGSSRLFRRPSSTTRSAFQAPGAVHQRSAQLRVQGDVVLRVTFTASGQVVVQGVVHGLGHGLDEEARRVAQQIRFRPATRNGQAVDLTTNITITFQLA